MVHGRPGGRKGVGSAGDEAAGGRGQRLVSLAHQGHGRGRLPSGVGEADAAVRAVEERSDPGREPLDLLIMRGVGHAPIVGRTEPSDGGQVQGEERAFRPKPRCCDAESPRDRLGPPPDLCPYVLDVELAGIEVANDDLDFQRSRRESPEQIQ